METLEQYRAAWTTGSGAPLKTLVHLPEDLQPVYQRVATHNLRLEQEQIHPAWVQGRLAKLL